MELSGSYFIYSGVSSRQYGLIFANVETDRMVSLAGDIRPTVMFNKLDNRNYLSAYDHSEAALQFDVEVVTDDDSCVDVFKARDIERWLFHQTGFQKLYVDPTCDTHGETLELVDGTEKRLYLNCVFTNPQRIEGNGGVVGYRFTVECDSSMAWQDAVVYEFDLSSIATGDPIITVPVDTDLNDYVYPKVTIQMGSSGGDITIVNQADDEARLTSFVNLTGGITFTMNGNGVNYISGDNYLKFSDRNFIRLLDGDNKISITGDVKTISFEFQNRRYA